MRLTSDPARANRRLEAASSVHDNVLQGLRRFARQLERAELGTAVDNLVQDSDQPMTVGRRVRGQRDPFRHRRRRVRIVRVLREGGRGRSGEELREERHVKSDNVVRHGANLGGRPALRRIRCRPLLRDLRVVVRQTVMRAPLAMQSTCAHTFWYLPSM
jgi:hypothetical protein